jgi:2-polyprenyl-3-methyl-5-hydroxy-6-metoxy-1,4-benzoquinol methylase
MNARLGAANDTKNETGGYPLGYSAAEARRLEVQGKYLEDLTADVFRRAGITRGMHILDIGCGVGDVSLLAAQMVGMTGSVLGIDRHIDSVEIARRRVVSLGIENVRFESADLNSVDTTSTFDAVVGRLVLLYQPDPAATLRRFLKFLRPNGIVAFQEIDIDMAQVPASEVFNRMRSWIIASLQAGGANPYMGSNLLRTFLAAGLPRPTMIAATRVESGPDSLIYEHHAQIVRSLLPLAKRAGVTIPEEIAVEALADRFREDAVAYERATFESRMVGAWTRLPF